MRVELDAIPEVDSINIYLLESLGYCLVIQFDFYAVSAWSWSWQILWRGKHYQALSICTPTFGFDIRWYR